MSTGFILFSIIVAPVIFAGASLVVGLIATGLLALLTGGRSLHTGTGGYVAPLTFLLAAGYTYYWIITPDPWPFRWVM